MPRNSGHWLVLLLVELCGLLCATNSHAQSPTFLISKRAVWKYFVGDAKSPDNWNQTSFDDTTWKSGPAGFGYGDDDDATEMVDLFGKHASVYVRRAFKLEQLADVDSLFLYVSFDDGFIAYLNGKQIASASVQRNGNSIRVEQHEVNGYEEFEIRNAKSLLKVGTNVLAIEGHNVSLDSSDFSLDPFLATSKVSDSSSTLTAQDYLADIDELERRLLDQSSYLTRRGLDSKAAIEQLRSSIHSSTRLADFCQEVQKLIMQIGDCHASVESSIALPASASLPIRPADTAQGVMALRMNQNQLLDEKCPCIESIDGIPLQQWLDAAAKYVPRGSPQLIRRRSLEWLGNTELLRKELGLPARETVTIGLRSVDGTGHTTQTLRLTGQGYAVARVRLRATRVLDGNIGYLRVPTMDDRLIEPTIASIKSFRDTKGMIIDVRGNSGGTYGLMRAIYGFFVPDDAAPRVTNIAAYRLSPTFASDHIAYRPTFRADWDGWTDEERTAIRRAAADFQPEWLPPQGKFSEWHYMILSRARSGRGNSTETGSPNAGNVANGYFFYDKPVIILSNAECFSAADGFLNAFADLPQVTIVGEASSGGSGATRQFRLPKTHLQIAISSMASFRPNGKLFDGHGIEVDVAVKPVIEDFTAGTDSVLAKGISELTEKLKP